MDFPKEDVEVLVKLDHGHFAVAKYSEGKWYAGDGVFPSHEEGIDILAGNVVEWEPLPEKLANQLEIKTNKPRI